MNLFGFEQNPLWLNLVVFAVGAAVVWVAGTRLSRYADAISDRTGLGQAFIGALLLGGITSLPEVATTVTASLAGNAPLAVNNVLGGVAVQIAILALADAATGARAISRVVNASVILLQGTLLVSALALVAAGIAAGPYVLFGIDLWTAAIFLLVVFGLYSIKRYEADPKWHPESQFTGGPGGDRPGGTEPSLAEQRRELVTEYSMTKLVSYTTAAGVGVVVGGYLVARSGDVLAVQTGLGAGFVGAIFLAIATSLPEVSTTLEAVRLGQHRLAFSNIFGTNLFDAALLFVADLFFRGTGVLEEVGAFAQFASLLGLLLTTVYLAGILRRGGRTIFRMGFDSVLVVALYLGGVAILYTLR